MPSGVRDPVDEGFEQLTKLVVILHFPRSRIQARDAPSILNLTILFIGINYNLRRWDAIASEGTEWVFSRMIIADGREAATPEDEKVFLDRKRRRGGDFECEQVKGRGLIGGSTPNDNLTRRRLTYT